MSAMRQKKCIFGRFSPLWCWVWARFPLFGAFSAIWRVFRYLARFPVKRTAFALLRCSNGRECRYNRLFFRCRPLPLTCSGLTGVLPASKVYLTYSRPIPGLYFCVPHFPAPKNQKFLPNIVFSIWHFSENAK